MIILKYGSYNSSMAFYVFHGRLLGKFNKYTIEQRRLVIYVKSKSSMQRSYQKTFWLKIENFNATTRDWNLPQCISDRKDDSKFDFLFLVQYKRSSLPGCYHRYTVLDLLVLSAISDLYIFLYSGFGGFQLVDLIITELKNQMTC